MSKVRKALSYERIQELAKYVGWHCLQCNDGGVIISMSIYSVKVGPDTILKDLRFAKKSINEVELDYIEEHGKEDLLHDEYYRKIGKVKVCLNHLYDIFRQNTNLDRPVADVIDALESCGFKAIIKEKDKSSISIYRSKDSYISLFDLPVPKEKDMTQAEMASFMKHSLIELAAYVENNRVYSTVETDGTASVSGRLWKAVEMLA